MPAERMSEMRNSHRLFLQGIMSRHILTAGEVKHLYRLSCERFAEDAGDDQLARFVMTINRKIGPIHMEVKKGVCEDTGSSYYALVNTQESSITKCSPDYTANELELFKKIVEKIVESENGEVRSIEATNLCDELDKKMTKKEGDEVIARMVSDKWFHSNSGRLSLHTRGIIELEQYLKDQYPEQVVCCEMCKKVCLKGQCCNRCVVKLHHHCANRYFKDRDNPTCPSRGCGAPWSHAIRRGAAAITPSQSSQAAEGEPSTPPTRKRRR